MKQLVELSPRVEGDLDAIADLIAEDSPARALAFIREAWRKILKVGEQPFLYLERYVIPFRVLDNVVRIERAVYGGRDLPALLE